MAIHGTSLVRGVEPLAVLRGHAGGDRDPGRPYDVLPVDESFISKQAPELEQRPPEYATNAAAYQAVLANPDTGSQPTGRLAIYYGGADTVTVNDLTGTGVAPPWFDSPRELDSHRARAGASSRTSSTSRSRSARRNALPTNSSVTKYSTSSVTWRWSECLSSGKFAPKKAVTPFTPAL